MKGHLIRLHDGTVYLAKNGLGAVADQLTAAQVAEWRNKLADKKAGWLEHDGLLDVNKYAQGKTVLNTGEELLNVAQVFSVDYDEPGGGAIVPIAGATNSKP